MRLANKILQLFNEQGSTAILWSPDNNRNSQGEIIAKEGDRFSWNPIGGEKKQGIITSFKGNVATIKGDDGHQHKVEL